MNKIRLAVLISGRGSNLQAIIDACAAPDFPAYIEVVISNIPEAYGLERARLAGITTRVVSHKEYSDREAFDAALDEIIASYSIDLICLAGFMRILTPRFVIKWQGRLINIHPSLLPKYKGLHTHERALEAGDLESGCSVHYVSAAVDEGDIILQRFVPICKGDTADDLAARVLEQEHQAYPEAIRRIATKILQKNTT